MSSYILNFKQVYLIFAQLASWLVESLGLGLISLLNRYDYSTFMYILGSAGELLLLKRYRPNGLDKEVLQVKHCIGWLWTTLKMVDIFYLL